MREVVEEAWGAFVDLDGRVLTTLRLLVTRPGELTAQWLAGRRARFVAPLRLYLLCSVAYFLVSSALPERGSRAVRKDAVRITVTGDLGKRLPESCAPTAERLGRVLRTLRALDCRTDRDPAHFEEVRRANMPRLLFALLPLFAGILAFAFRGHTYPEHLWFALHLHAFVFLAITVGRAADLVPSRLWNVLVDGAVWLSVIAYAVVALRRTYGRSWGGTLARSVAVGAVYGVVFVVGLIALVLVAAALM
jgi:hypothetical protein